MGEQEQALPDDVDMGIWRKMQQNQYSAIYTNYTE